MASSKKQIDLKIITQKIYLSRIRIISSCPFFGVFLTKLPFYYVNDSPRAYTNGEAIFVNPAFIATLNEKQIDFVILHEIMHIILKHCFRFNTNTFSDKEKLNLACDIVINSNIMHLLNLTEDDFVFPDNSYLPNKINGSPGYLYSAEEVYQMLHNMNKKDSKYKGDKDKVVQDIFDDHSHWKGENENTNIKIDEIDNTIKEALEIHKNSIASSSYGLSPAFIENYIKKTKTNLDWVELLHQFLHFEELDKDYSFTPPSRRENEDGFILPDYNIEEFYPILKDVVFLVDVSGSMSDKIISRCVSEIQAVTTKIDSIKAYFGFFDVELKDLYPLENHTNLFNYKIFGRGGTSINSLIKDIKERLKKLPDALIILSDGILDYNNHSILNNIPILWIITNNHSKPPYGIVARITDI